MKLPLIRLDFKQRRKGCKRAMAQALSQKRSNSETGLDLKAEATRKSSALGTRVSLILTRPKRTFVPLHFLGKGAYGNVLLCKQKFQEQEESDSGLKRVSIQQDEYVALKVMHKGLLLCRHAKEQVEKEVLIMRKLRNLPCVAQMRDAFQTDDHVVIQMPIYLGGDFLTFLRTRDRLEVHVARFYMSEIALGVEFLHSREILYGDLKPENVLIDACGHVSLADFGLAKDFAEDSAVLIDGGTGRKTMRVASGSLLYASPESLERRPIGLEADWWAFGVVLYETLIGRPLFATEDSEASIQETCERICELDLVYELSGVGDFVGDADAEDLLLWLLKREPTARLGFTKIPNTSIIESEVLSHPFFEQINKEELISKRLEPPVKPIIEGPTDIRNVDDEFRTLAPELPIGPEIEARVSFSGLEFESPNFPFADSLKS